MDGDDGNGLTRREAIKKIFAGGVAAGISVAGKDAACASGIADCWESGPRRSRPQSFDAGSVPARHTVAAGLHAENIPYWRSGQRDIADGYIIDVTVNRSGAVRADDVHAPYSSNANVSTVMYHPNDPEIPRVDNGTPYKAAVVNVDQGDDRIVNEAGNPVSSGGYVALFTDPLRDGEGTNITPQYRGSAYVSETPENTSSAERIGIDTVSDLLDG